MSKKILFMSSAKLTTISLGLLLVIFCTIGMSFRPVYGEDEAELVMAGPRMSHWTTESGGCNSTTTYHNKTDYAKTVAQSLGNGSVTIASASKGTITNSSATTSGSQSYVEWNTGVGSGDVTGKRDDLGAIHANTITFVATPSDPQEYRFVGWYDNASGTGNPVSTNISWETEVAFATAAGITSYGTGEVTTYQSNPWTKTYYAKFEAIPSNNVKFLAASTPSRDNGSYTVVGKNVNQTITTSDQTIGVKGVTLTATPTEAAVFVRWFTQDGNGSRTTLSTENPYNAAFTAAATVGVEWKELTNHHNLTFKAVELDANDNPVGTYTVNSTTVSTSDYNYNTGDAYKFKPTMTVNPETGYMFTGWYAKHGKRKDLLSTDNPWNPTFTQDSVICAGFAFNGYTDDQKAQFKANGQYFTDLTAANNAAKSASTKTIICTRDGILPPGNYEISSGVTLYIPYSTSEDARTTPAISQQSAPALSCYRKLIMVEGANITCNGTICVGGQICSMDGGQFSGYPVGACGVLDMSAGGHVELNGTLYAWGFVKGQDMDQGNNTLDVGTITANSGSTVWEDFAEENRGGSASSDLVNNDSYRTFPFQGYAIQNIEVPVTYKYGANLKNYTSLYIKGNQKSTFPVIGSSDALFLLKNNKSIVKKWYDPTTDLACYELSGTAQLDAIVASIYVSVNSKDYNLPLSSNMRIILRDCNMTLSKPIQILPDAIIEITESATVNLETNLFLFDKDEWLKGVNSLYYATFKNLTNHKNRGDGTSNAILGDAKLIVDGTLNITSSGRIYATAGGANIMGNGGGKIVFPSTLASSATLYQLWGAAGGTKTSTSITISSLFASDAYLEPVPVNTANLCNEDESYTKAIASTTFYNVHGRWFKSGNQNENADDHTYNFTYIASGAVSGTGGTDVSPNTHNAVYAPDKTGLTAGMKWCNVVQDGTCSNIFNATQALNETPASDIRYTYPSSEWLQLIKTETEGVYGGSDNSLYAVEGCAVNSLGSVDENCLYTINEVKKALVDGHFVALEKNTEDEAWHDVANPTNYYICFEGCNWHPATKYAGEEKAYIVEEGDYIWYNNDWLLVEREDPFFYSLDETNVPIYYEYENDEWVLASYKVKLVDKYETRRFYFLSEAIAVANGKTNTTITILKDISGIDSEMTFTAANTTCTLDLNGHTVSGACAKLLTINAAGSTFTITDNTTEKNGRLENIFNQNAVTYNVTVTAGTLNLNAGTIYVQNLRQYRYKSKATDNETAMGARAVQVAAAQKFNLTGGRVEAQGKYYVYGIVGAGSAANKTEVNISGTGEVYAEGALYTYGISCAGKLNMSGGLVEAHLNSSWANSYNTEGSDADKNAHAECYAIHMSASANKTASSCYYGTLTVTGGTIKASSDVVRSYTSNVTGIRMYYSVAGMGNRNFASTSGTNAEQACAIGSVKNAEIIVQNNANYGYGILVYGHYNSYNKTNSVFKVENTTVDVKAFNYAYGVYACGGIDGTTGECFTGDVELTNCTIAAEATNATTNASYAYGAWVYAGATTIFQDKQANYYGEYATAAKMTINGGSITAKTKTHYAYTAGTSTRARSTYEPQTSVYASRTRGGNAEAYPTLIINGGTYRAISGQQHARGISSGGNTTVKDAIFHVTAGTYNTYGLYAISGKLTATNVTVNDTAKSHSSNNANVYGVLADCSIPAGNTAQTGFAYAGEVELNNCTITAVSPSYSNARALYVNATNKVHNWTQFFKDSTSYTSTWAANKSNYAALYRRVFPCTIEGRDSVSVAIAAKATVNGGTFTAKAGKASAYGAVSTQTSVPANKEVTASPVMNLYDATFTATTGTSTTAYGVQSGGPTLIEGCTIEATAGNATTYQSTASGVRALDKTTTIKNSTITATATDKAYGLEGYVEINGTHGYCWHGEFNLSEAGNTEVTAEAKTKAKTSYAIYLNATKKAIASGNFAGDYATAANATINGGTYVAKFNTSGSAYVISLAGKQTQGSVVAQPEVEVLDGFFNGATAEVGTAGVVGHMQLKGGYFVHNTNLATYAVAPKSVWTLPNTNEHYDPYKYKITEHYNITFKNGSTQLQQDDLEVGSTPLYTGTPTKAGDAQYSYTFDGWSTTDGGDKLASLPAVTAVATYFAHFTKTEQKYSVSVISGGHGSVSPASVSNIGCETASGDIIATPDAGYSFSNWTLPDGVTAAAGYTTSSNPIRIHATAAENTITANFAAKKYTVTLDDQSATTAGQASVTATYDAAMPSIAGNLPEKIGHEFGGYYSATNGGGTQYYNANGTSAHIWDIDAASPTLYAKWTPQTYNITYKDKGNVAFSGVHGSGYPMKHTYGTATELVDPSREGYIFEGWFTSQDCSTGEVATLGATAYTADITLYAKWRQNKVTVTWDATTNGGTAADPATTKVTPGEAVGTLATTSKTGHSYKWYTAPTGGTEVTAATKVSEDKTFYAQFTANTHKLAWNFDGGTPSGNYTEANNALAYGSTITYPTLSKTGYTFAGWSTNATSMPDADLTITASWTPNTNTAYTVKHYKQKLDGTYASTPDETDNLTGTTGASVTPDRKSYEGFDAPAGETVTILADGSRVVTYNYTRKSYTLTWVTDGDALTGTYTNGSTKFGAAIIAPNTPTKTGYTFASWNPTKAATMPAANTTYTATWTINQYTLTVVANDAMGTVSGGGTYDYNTAHTITATPKAGFKFVKWQEDGDTHASREVTVTANVTYTATFDYDIANYTVKHWQQNIYDDGYTEVEGDRQEKSGTIGTLTNAEAKSYTGFDALPFDQETIAVSGTEVNIRYNRKTYLIKWEVTLNGEQEAYKEETLRYGAMPSYGADPAKESSVSWVYTFSGWNPTPYAVDKPQEYSGSFHVTAHPYLITFVNDDNTTVLQSSQVGWGSTPSYTGSKPVSTIDASYEFIGWTPAITEVAEAATYVATYKHLPINVLSGDTVTINMNTVTTTTTVHVAGELIVEDGKTLSTNDLIIEGSADGSWNMSSGEILGEGEVSATNAYYDMMPDGGYKDHIWYAVAVPWTVNVPKNDVGDVYDADGHRLRLNLDFDLLYYNGASRAAGGTNNWNSVAKDAESEWVMKPGTAYMIYLARPTAKLRFKKSAGALLTTTVDVVTHEETTGNNGKDANWNGIANPALYHAYLNAGTKDNYGQVFVPGKAQRDGGSYLTVNMSDSNLVVGQPIFVQAQANKSVMAYTSNEGYGSHAPRRAQAEVSAQNASYAVEIAANGVRGDRIFVAVSDDKEDAYTIGQDVCKLGTSTTKPQMWINRYNSKLCVNTMELTAKKATYPLGISVPADGDYEIYVNAEMQDGQDLYVTYNDRVIWNLTYGPYVASLTSGTHTEYGLKLVQSPAVTTDIETVNGEGSKVSEVRKVLIDDHIYIIREGVVYSINGQQAQ